MSWEFYADANVNWVNTQVEIQIASQLCQPVGALSARRNNDMRSSQNLTLGGLYTSGKTTLCQYMSHLSASPYIHAAIQ
jgi:hypothetical protein